MLKKQQPARKTALVGGEQSSHRSTQQFNATPRFRPAGAPNVPASTPSAAHYLTPRHPAGIKEDISDQLSSSLPDVHDSIETEDQDAGLAYPSTDTDHNFMIQEPDAKRRRLSSSPILKNHSEENGHQERDGFTYDLNSSPPPAVASPTAHRRPFLSTAPRFLDSTQPILQQDQSAFLKPPRFRPPDSAEPAQQSDPLPDQFSPHKRGQKYVPGGLAAEVRDWLVNIDSSIPSSSTVNKDSQWKIRLMVDEVSGGVRSGFTLVRGRQVKSGDVDTMIDSVGDLNVVLAGEGTSMGLQKNSKVEVGKIVGIKSPVWEVIIEGKKWGVGVDWTVLGGLDG